MSQYYPSGTGFSFQAPSTYAPGTFLYGNDSTAQWVTVSGSAGPLTGSNGAYKCPVTTSQVNHALPAALSGVTYLIGAEDQGNTGSTTPASFRVVDVSGIAATNSIAISGASASVLINGSVSPITLSTNYQVKNFVQILPNQWIAF
jgi:hypothetical protein